MADFVMTKGKLTVSVMLKRMWPSFLLAGSALAISFPSHWGWRAWLVNILIGVALISAYERASLSPTPQIAKQRT